MEAGEITPYTARFVTVTLDDGTEISGYIANAEEFRKDPDHVTHITLVNGLQNSVTEIERIIDIKAVKRQDTTEIPVVGESSDVTSLVRRREEQKKSQSFDEKLDELFDKSLSDTLEVKLPNGKVIQSHSEDE